MPDQTITFGDDEIDADDITVVPPRSVLMEGRRSASAAMREGEPSWFEGNLRPMMEAAAHPTSWEDLIGYALPSGLTIHQAFPLIGKLRETLTGVASDVADAARRGVRVTGAAAKGAALKTPGIGPMVKGGVKAGAEALDATRPIPFHEQPLAVQMADLPTSGPIPTGRMTAPPITLRPGVPTPAPPRSITAEPFMPQATPAPRPVYVQPTGAGPVPQPVSPPVAPRGTASAPPPPGRPATRGSAPRLTPDEQLAVKAMVAEGHAEADVLEHLAKLKAQGQAAPARAATGAAAQAGPKVKLSAAEAKEYGRLRMGGKTDAEARDLIAAQQELAKRFGLPSSEETRQAVSKRNATGRWDE